MKKFERLFNRAYEMFDFPHFVPKDESEGNNNYARAMIDGRWIYHRWREDVERGNWVRNKTQAERIAAHGGMILEICAGPGGGFFPSVLMADYNANILVSDLCPTVLTEWQKHLQGLENPPPNVEYAVFDVCDIPLNEASIDVVSGSAAIVNIEGDRDKALHEVYRVLKKGGLFVFDFDFITEEFHNKMPPHSQKIIKEEFPTIFWDTLSIFDELGFSKIETIQTGTWSNETDESTLADLCRSLNTPITFSSFMRYCVK